MSAKTIMDENGCIVVPRTIRERLGLKTKTEIIIVYDDNVFVMGNSSSANDKLGDIIKKTYALINFENTFQEIHAKNLKISDEEIIKDIKEYRRVKRENKQNGV